MNFEGRASLRTLAADADAMFVLSGSGRILRENDPDRSDGPRVSLTGCQDGNLVHLRHDVGEVAAQAVLSQFQAEPPWSDPAVRPGCVDRVLEILALDGPVGAVTASTIYALPHGLVAATEARLVCSGTPAGDELIARLADAGVPPHLHEAGFVGVGDFWTPWCVALEGEAIAAMAFAARLGEDGAEIGVYTFPGFRGRGLAAAVTAAWSSLPELGERQLFYSALTTNLSSHRVAARLGLRAIGASLRID